MDRHTKEQRRKNMQAIKRKDTKIELMLRKSLWKNGLRYRVDCKDIFGSPDIAIKKYKIAVFCDSEFFHGYNWANQKDNIKSNKEYWISKIERNMQRDKNVNKILKDNGWLVIRFWGFEIIKDVEECTQKIIESIQARKKVKKSND
ncbi:very short patch repair endonuclease [Clostridium thermarum]|uniref:very short patch repair endonuclease n=1 Tax=Clostridium thermarum TaxID=1716543 RepID=UPI0011208F5D|nr:very short patch repair endonuclease [Clostridium thermarum]